MTKEKIARVLLECDDVMTGRDISGRERNTRARARALEERHKQTYALVPVKKVVSSMNLTRHEITSSVFREYKFYVFFPLIFIPRDDTRYSNSTRTVIS